jgi:malate dehydrogenase (oxaloacetate-decarboxylating)
MGTPTAAFSINLLVQLDNAPGTLGRLATEIGSLGGNIAAVSGFEAKGPVVTEEVVVHCRDEAHAAKVVEAARVVPGVTVLDAYDRTFRMHEGGKIEVVPTVATRDRDDLSMAYTPGVARVCMAIHDRPELSFDYTIRKNTVAIVSDGTAVLGLGDIGPLAAMPVMEGKALLFKEFGGVDAFPVCLDTKDLTRSSRPSCARRRSWHQPRRHRARSASPSRRSSSAASTSVFHDISTAPQSSRCGLAQRAAHRRQKMDEITVVIARRRCGRGVRQILLSAASNVIGTDARAPSSWCTTSTSPRSGSRSTPTSIAGRARSPRCCPAPTCSSV